MSLPMQMKISMSVIVDAALLLLVMTLLLKEVSATCRQMHGITDKRMNVHSSVAVEGLALWQSLADGQPENNLPKPPPPPQSSIVGSSLEAGLAGKSCGPHHEKNVPMSTKFTNREVQDGREWQGRDNKGSSDFHYGWKEQPSGYAQFDDLILL